MRPISFRRPAVALVLTLLAVSTAPAIASAQVTTPKEFFGHNIGDDYWLPNYTQFLAYWQKIARQSPARTSTRSA